MSPPIERSNLADAKVMVLITEDWFVLSHFKPLIRTLVANCGGVVVITTNSGRIGEIRQLGARVIAFDFDRASSAPLRQFAIVRRLRRMIRRERPDVVHAIALKPIALGGLAVQATPKEVRQPLLVMHLTGAGPTVVGDETPLASVYAMTLRLMQWMHNRPHSMLLVENPDDAARVAGVDWMSQGRVRILGGAGVDPDVFKPLSRSRRPGQSVVIGFLGRMLWTKGVGVLVNAVRLLRRSGVDVVLRLGGMPDPANRWAIPEATLDEWRRVAGIEYLGHVGDTPAFWQQVDVAVVPSSWGEGMPRVLLEAAATALPLVVTDVPGCRHFVRHEQNGLIVAPNDAAALADAVARLAADTALANRLGQNARHRLLDGFTERHVAEGIVAAYEKLLQK